MTPDPTLAADGAIKQLTDQQVQTWTPEQKDRWWLTEVFRGQMPQLTLRAAITGFILGGLLSATNLYIGAKTGWSLGVGLTSVILAFALFKALSSIKLVSDFTILENNAMQSIATAAGYMTGPLISGIAAYMMVKNELMPWHQMLLFNIVLSILGVLVAFPMKRRFINYEQQPFPEGRACGVLLHTLYNSAASVGLFKAKALVAASIFAGTIKFLCGENYHTFIQNKIFGLKTVRYLSDHPVEKFLGYLGGSLPSVQGIPIKQLDLNPTMNLEMFGAGGLMNIRYGTNMLIGMVLMWLVVAPPIINQGDVINSKGAVLTPLIIPASGPTTFRSVALAEPFTVAVPKTDKADAYSVTVANGAVTRSDGGPVTLPLRIDSGKVLGADGKPAEYEPGKPIVFTSQFGRSQVLNSWALWPGVALLVCASMTSLFAKPGVLISAFTGLFKRRSAEADPVAHIEVPLWISFVGIPIVGAIGVIMAHEWFGVQWIWGALAIPLTIVLTLIAAQATALTSITPTGSLSKITQFTFGGLDRKFPAMVPGPAGSAGGTGGGLVPAPPNAGVNLMTACMTTEVASNAANLLMDIKPGYMLGAKPRQQAVGHVIGIIAGAIASTPLFYILFLAGHPDNPFTRVDPKLAGKSVEDVLLQDTEKFSFAGAVQWKGISDLITKGLSSLPPSAVTVMIIAAVAGIAFELIRVFTKNKSPISPLALGLGIVLPPDSTIWMFLGALFFFIMGKIYANRPASTGNKLWIQTHEPICAGLVAGAALIGIGDMLVKVFVLP